MGTEKLDIDHSQMFADALRDDPDASEAPERVAEPVAEQPGPEQPAIARDDKGRFAPKAEQTQEQPAEQQAEQPAMVDAQASQAKQAYIPPSRLKEEADARRKAEEEREFWRQQAMQAMQTRQQPNQLQPQVEHQEQADPLIALMNDPNAWVNQQLTAQLAPMRIEYSHRDAVRTHGEEAVQEARTAAEQAVQQGRLSAAELQKLFQTDIDPVGKLVQWHKREKIMSEVGTDPSAYESKVLEKALSNPEFLAKAAAAIQASQQQAQPAQARPNTAAPVVRIPPSLSRATSVAPNHSVDAAASLSDADLYHFATR